MERFATVWKNNYNPDQCDPVCKKIHKIPNVSLHQFATLVSNGNVNQATDFCCLTNQR